MSEKVKSILSTTLGIVLFFTLAIPVIPVGGVLAYNHFYPNQKQPTTSNTNSTEQNSPIEDVGEDQQYETDNTEYEQDTSFDESQDEYSETDDSGGYVNIDGNYVQSPNNNQVGASAQCSDGTYSHSQHRSGTCSYHGGIAR